MHKSPLLSVWLGTAWRRDDGEEDVRVIWLQGQMIWLIILIMTFVKWLR